MGDGHLYGIAVRLTHGFTYKANSLGFALANLDTSEGHGCATDFLEQVADGLGRILDVGLLEQDVLLVEGVETAFNDLRNDLLRLAFSQGLLGATRRSDSTTSAGTSSRVSHWAPIAEICKAAS